MTLNRQKLIPLILFIGFLGLLVVSQSKVSAYKLPLPTLADIPVAGQGLQDLSFVVSGFRLFGSDVAWVQVLQFLSSREKANDKTSTLDYLKPNIFRVTTLDPYFKRAYYFGAGVLAYIRTIDRPLEAVDVLKSGIYWNPNCWGFHSFLLSLGYKKFDNPDMVVEAMRPALRDPECPPLVKAILANTYEKYGKYQESLDLWYVILNDTKDRSHVLQAQEKIEKIERILHQKKSRP